MSSAYATPGTTKESLQFTNITSGFVDNLDYILYEKEMLEVTDLLFVPQSYEVLNDFDLPNGHLLPSAHWPSDHLAIGCVLALKNSSDRIQTDQKKEKPTVQASLPEDIFCSLIPEKEHGERCNCGCIPPILSLFEMAELRKQARMKQASSK
jgi:hypothetical protein